ncbi:MAG TPA: glucan biosynthesis glucosyltransferase H, partial [Solimonas sp.]
MTQQPLVSAPPFPRRVEEYLRELPPAAFGLLWPRLQERLRDAPDTSTEQLFAEIHCRLAENEEADADLATLQSSSTRLKLSLLKPQRGDAALDGMLQLSDARARLASTPPLVRASMTPSPWDHNPVRRLWRWLGRRAQGDGAGLKPRHGAEAAAP